MKHVVPYEFYEKNGIAKVNVPERCFLGLSKVFGE